MEFNCVLLKVSMGGGNCSTMFPTNESRETIRKVIGVLNQSRQPHHCSYFLLRFTHYLYPADSPNFVDLFLCQWLKQLLAFTLCYILRSAIFSGIMLTGLLSPSQSEWNRFSLFQFRVISFTVMFVSCFVFLIKHLLDLFAPGHDHRQRLRYVCFPCMSLELRDLCTCDPFLCFPTFDKRLTWLDSCCVE